MDRNGDMRGIVIGWQDPPDRYAWPYEPSERRKNAIREFARFARSNNIRVLLTWPDHKVPAHKDLACI